MDMPTALYHIINSLHGGSVSRQFLDVIGGDSVDDQNENAIRDIKKTLTEIASTDNEIGYRARHMLEVGFA